LGPSVAVTDVIFFFIKKKQALNFQSLFERQRKETAKLCNQTF